MAAVLATPVARSLLNDFDFSAALIPVWTFCGGAVYALAVYWIGGGLLYGSARRFGGLGSYLRAKHLLALSAAPLALSHPSRLAPHRRRQRPRARGAAIVARSECVAALN